MTELVAVDIGGTHARFAVATLGDGAPQLGETVTLRTADHGSFTSAWHAFAATAKGALPRAASIAMAGPIGAEALKLTNNPWIIRPAALPGEIGVDALTLVNDFGAIAHAVAHIGLGDTRLITGPEAFPDEGVISVIGPGTGLGVAILLRRAGHGHVIETEGGHIDYAPLDAIESRILDRLRTRYVRVSAERIASGPGLANIYEALAAIGGQAIAPTDDKTLWAAALAGEDRLAVTALERFCLAFGAVVGDLALAHGANAVVLAGGVAARVADLLPTSGFAERFAAKGRFASRMRDIPVRLCLHPQPGLLGAAAAFQEEHAAPRI